MGKIKPTLSERWNELINTDFIYCEDIVEKFSEYIKFQSRDVEIWMLMAWDMENNCPMEKPEDYDIHDYNALTYKNQRLYLKDCKKYQQAEERILFEGFGWKDEWENIVIENDQVIIIYNKKSKSFFYIKTIADLGAVELTKNGELKAGI